MGQAQTKSEKMELGYWDIRGLAAPLRMMMAYGGCEYTDKMFDTGESWFKDRKPAVLEKNALANLPYIIDGDCTVTQSTACMVYLAEKIGVYGGIKDLEMLSEVYDLRNSLMELVYPFKKVNRDEKEFNVSTEAQCAKVAPKFYAKFEAVLKKKFLIADTPCACDFHAWEMIDQHELLAAKYAQTSPLSEFPKLKVYYETFKALPQLQAYFESDKYKLPCNNALGGAYFL